MNVSEPHVVQRSPRPLTQPAKRPARAAVYLSVDLSSEHNFWTGLTMNLSEGGLFVATHMTFPKGSRIALHLDLPGCATPVFAVAEVCWYRNAGGDEDVPPGLGLKFVGLEPEALAAIRTFVTTMREPLLFEN